MAVESDILNVLKGQLGLKGREIASQLKVDKAEVNSMHWILQNRGLARQDNQDEVEKDFGHLLIYAA